MMANHEGLRALQQDPPEYGSMPPGLNEPVVNNKNNKIDQVPQATVDLAEQVVAGIAQRPVERVSIDEIKSGQLKSRQYPGSFSDPIATIEDDELDQEEITTEDMVTDRMATQRIVTEEDTIDDARMEWNVGAPPEVQAGQFSKIPYPGRGAREAGTQPGDNIELGPSGNAVDDEIQTAVRARADRPIDRPPVTPPVPSPSVEPSLQTKIDTFDQRIRELEQQLNDTSGWRLLRKASLRRDLASLQKHKARYFQTYPELQRAADARKTEVTINPLAAAERLREQSQLSGQERVVQLRDAVTGVLERRAYTISDPIELTDAQIDKLYTQILADRQRLLSQQPSQWAPITQQRTWEGNFQRLENRRRVYAAAQHARRESAKESAGKK